MIFRVSLTSVFLLLALSTAFEQVLDNVMTLGWTIDLEKNEIFITLKCALTTGYCSVGLRSSMTNCDMFAVMADGTSVEVVDYWSRNHDTPYTDDMEGGTQDYTYVSGGISNGMVDVTMKRKLDTGDIFDQAITPDQKSHICWAYLTQRPGWREHSDFASASFTWATTSNNLYFKVLGDERYEHGVALSIAWGFLAVVGILAARYFKYTSWWIYIHVLFLLVASLITIISSTSMFKSDEYPVSGLSDESLDHSRVGMIMSSIVISQVVFGCMCSYFKILTRNVQGIMVIVRAHKIIGYAMLIVGLFNCVRGWDIYKGSGMAIMIIAVIVTITLFGGFEINQICRRNRKKVEKLGLKEIEHKEAMEMIKNGKKIMFADDLVLDVKPFIWSHPGGAFMLSECIGEDAGKYMVGCSSFGGNLNPYSHSKKAFSYLNDLAIGRIPCPAGYIYPPSEGMQELMMFTVYEKQALNDHTFLIYLKSDEFKMASNCDHPIWLGKHFMVSFTEKLKEVRRYYSSIFVDINSWGSELGLVQTANENKGMVKFIFKYYPGGKMTTLLNNLKPGNVLKIKGPLGPGLLLENFKGRYLALAGGTGLVPFLDLVYKAWKEVNSKLSDFHLTLFVFFRTKKDGFALEILEKMKTILDGSWFNLFIITDESPNKKEVPELVKAEIKDKPDLAWICGPSGFNRYYADLMVKSGLEKEKVILM